MIVVHSLDMSVVHWFSVANLTVITSFCIYAVHWVWCKVARSTKSSFYFIRCCLQCCGDNDCRVISSRSSSNCCHDSSSVHTAHSRRHLTTSNVCCSISPCEWCLVFYKFKLWASKVLYSVLYQQEAESEALVWATRGTEGPLKQLALRRPQNVCDDECEWHMGVSSILRGSNTETTGSKGCVDSSNWQQIGVGGA